MSLNEKREIEEVCIALSDEAMKSNTIFYNKRENTISCYTIFEKIIVDGVVLNEAFVMAMEYGFDFDTYTIDDTNAEDNKIIINVHKDKDERRLV